MSLRESALQAVRTWGQADPASWGTGLSEENARQALSMATQAVLRGPWPSQTREVAPRILLWCASNVFTAPLPWVTLFAGLGSRVVLKAPTACPEPVLALAKAFGDLPVEAHARGHSEAFSLLSEVDAVMAFGPDSAMAELDSHLPPDMPRSFHGHRVSFSVVESRDQEALAARLALDCSLYDSRGCMSPAAVFCLGDAEALAVALAKALESMAATLPRGEILPSEGPEWRRRTGLARARWQCWEGPEWAVPLLPVEYTQPTPLPRMLPIHPVADLESLHFLRSLPLSSCATNLDSTRLSSLGFHRICRPGELQDPPFSPIHDGVDLLKRLAVPG